jgi:hypothetical protein
MISKTSLWKNNNKHMSAGSTNFIEDNIDCSSSDDSQNKMNSNSKNRSLKTNSQRTTTIECRPSKSRFRNVFVVVLLTTFACIGVGVDSSSINDCRGVRFAYSARGLDIKDVPRQPRQGRTNSKPNVIFGLMPVRAPNLYKRFKPYLI